MWGWGVQCAEPPAPHWSRTAMLGFRRIFEAIVSSLATTVCLALILGIALFAFPQTPLSDRFNPLRDFDPLERPSFLTRYKFDRALKNENSCFALLDALKQSYSKEDDHLQSPACHIKERTVLASVGQAQLPTLETTCETALRLALWEYHHIQPTALAIYDQKISKIAHQGSYSCRKIRTVSGPSERMSEHATANAVDIKEFTLESGERISLRDGWDHPQHASFLRTIRDGSCIWFNATLSPDYNELHADHFHLDAGRWSTCR